MTPAQRRALDLAHDLVERHEVAGQEDITIAAEEWLELHELLHRAGAGQRTATQDMRRLAEIAHERAAAGQPCALCGHEAGVHDDDCPAAGAMGRYPETETP